MKKLSFILFLALTISCSKDEETCRCQAATDVSEDVYIEKRCEDLTAADVEKVLLYAGTELGAQFVYTDTATTICD
jgi:hypothetical protein